MNETNFNISSKIKASRDDLMIAESEFPYQDLTNPGKLKFAVESVTSFMNKSITKLDKAIERFYNKTQHSRTTADDAIDLLANATDEMKSLIKNAEYNCSINVIPIILPTLTKYSKEIIDSCVLIKQHYMMFYGSSFQALDKLTAASLVLKTTLQNCAVANSKQNCIDKFVSGFTFLNTNIIVFDIFLF